MVHKKYFLFITICYLLSACANDESKLSTPTASAFNEAGFSQPRMVEMHPNTTPLPAEQSLKVFRLPVGYRLELVACEPMISEPAAIAWDGNGRMYVAQLETYMQTIDAKGQDKAVSRIMRLEDTDGDGRMDNSSVFADSLLSPRMILCVGDELLVNETNTYDIYAYRDGDGDGRAEQKRRVYGTGEKAYGNVEHQRSGLDWNIDNWIYVTTDPVRFRYSNKKLIADSLAFGNNGQWGLTHDDYGRLFYSRAASGTVAAGFHVNPQYGQLDFTHQYDDSVFNLVWPGVITPDANARLRADSTLINFTGVCGQSVFRGDRLPAGIKGDYFAAEPVGRVIRRAKLSSKDGVITLRNPYNQDEFITTPDMNFRPVNTYTGPDGCVYIVDMYRGIIQESEWVRPDMAIYKQIKSKRLDKNIRRGRIYRLVYEGIERGASPRMLNEPSAHLISYFDHPNGWWRDNAQKEIIVREDRSVIPALKQMLLSPQIPALARLHALWTLEGLNAIDREILFRSLHDDEQQIRKAAVRISERFLAKGDKEIISALENMKDDPDIYVRAQLLLSLSYVPLEKTKAIALAITRANDNNALINSIDSMLVKNAEVKKYGSTLVAFREPTRKMIINGKRIFNSLCASCHGPEGRGLPSAVAPPLIGKISFINDKEAMIGILLHGLSGPVDGKTYPDQMVSMAANDDEWIASVLNYVRFDLSMQSFPKLPPDYLDWLTVRPEEVRKVREAHAGRSRPWTWEEILKKKNSK